MQLAIPKWKKISRKMCAEEDNEEEGEEEKEKEEDENESDKEEAEEEKEGEEEEEEKEAVLVLGRRASWEGAELDPCNGIVDCSRGDGSNEKDAEEDEGDLDSCFSVS